MTVRGFGFARRIGGLALLLASAGPGGVGAAAADDKPATAQGFVEVTTLAPGIRVELRYATTNNFMKRAVYPASARCYLRAPVAARLAAVQRVLEASGLGLKVYDCYRPRPVQQLLWDITPDERYVAPPSKGSRHNRGAAVDLTLVDAQGRELPMPTEYDAFSVKAHRSFGDLPAEQKQNRARLEDAMKAAGFVPLSTEWWHFDDPDSARYPLAEIGFDELLQKDAPPK